MKSPITFLHGIIIIIILSVVGLTALIIFSQTTDFNMVEQNYYEKSLQYQKQIERIERTNSLPEKVSIEHNKTSLIIKFPSIFNPLNIDGTIQLYRPSNSKLDLDIPLELSVNGEQEIPTNNLVNGVWIVKITWSNANQEYYSEIRINI